MSVVINYLHRLRLFFVSAGPPYNYAFDNPIRYVDPDGMSPSDIIYLNKQGKEIGRKKQPGEDYIVQFTDDKYSLDAQGLPTSDGSNQKAITKHYYDKHLKGKFVTPPKTNSTPASEDPAKVSSTTTDPAHTEPESDHLKPVESANNVVSLGAAATTIGAKQLTKLAVNAANSAETVEETIRMAQGVKTGSNVMSAFESVSRYTGYVDAGLAIRDAWNNPTLGNVTKAGVKTVVAFIKTNPVVNLLSAIADMTGLTDWLFSW